MLPYISIFGHDVPMYGLLMLTGGTLAVLFACLRGGRRGLNRLDILLAAIFAFVAGLLGAKVLYILTDIPNMVAHFQHAGFSWSWLFNRIGTSGIVFYGGLIGGFLGGWAYTKLFYLNFWKYADSMIPFLPLAHAFGRLGCFCAGCCYGRPMDPPWGVYFTTAIGGADPSVSYFPSQLLEAGFNLLILFPVMLLFSRKDRKPGQIVGLYFISYGIFRFVNEFFRGDEIRGIFGGVSTSQWVSLALIPIGVILISGLFSDKLRIFDSVLTEEQYASELTEEELLELENELNEDLDELEEDIDELEEDLEKIEDELDELEEDIGELEDSAD